MIEPFNLFLMLVFAFAAAMFYMVYLMARASGETNNDRLATQAEIGRRAEARGRSFAGGRRLSAWTMHGKLAGDEAWTLAYSVARDTDPASGGQPDWLEGQKLEWRCPAFERKARVFSFFSRPGGQKPGDLWQRWRLEFADGPNEAIARRTFGPAACALIERLPSGMDFPRHIDQRTTISCGGDGLVAVLGVDELTADLVDLWIEICETIAQGLK